MTQSPTAQPGKAVRSPARAGKSKSGAMSAEQKRALRAQAHALHPVVMIGQDGLTPAVIAETDRALSAHELIKVRVLGDDRELRTSFYTELCQATGALPIQMIGKLLVLYRVRPEPDPANPEDAARKPRRAPAGSRANKAGFRPKRTLQD